MEAVITKQTNWNILCQDKVMGDEHAFKILNEREWLVAKLEPGDVDSVIAFNKIPVYKIDGVATLIYSVKGNVAKCAILNNDLTLSRCYVAKSGDYFAHGKTIQDAVRDATNKSFTNKPIEERIKEFVLKFNAGKKYPTSDFYSWHTVLTGFCELGKKSFVENNGIDLKEKITVQSFIELVKNQYGSEVINKLKKHYQ